MIGGGIDPVSRGRLLAVRAQHSIFTADPALTHAGADLLDAAQYFRGNDATLEQAALLQAFFFTLPAERLAIGPGLIELGQRLGEGAGRHTGVASTILDGLSAHILLPYAQAVPAMRRAVAAIDELGSEGLLEFGFSSVALTTALWDWAKRRELLERTAIAAREAGSLHLLDMVLWTMSNAELKGGTPRQARHYMEQVRELRRAMGFDAEHVINVALLALTDVPRLQVETIAEGAGAVGYGGVQAAGQAGLALRDLAEGHYADAFDKLRPLVENPFLQVTPLEYADFVEAGARSGRVGQVYAFVEVLEAMADANGSAWTRGVAARARALVSGSDAETHYREAIAELGSVGIEVELGRAHLNFGQWLRRARRRSEAREHLRQAVSIFDHAQTHAFAVRSRIELGATGEKVGTSAENFGIEATLTQQELTVARLAASGHTNIEIGATMFLSSNTVDYHLRKVFRKLGVSSRRQLVDVLRMK